MDTKDKVKKYRKEKKLTQKQLGELSGLSEITIRKLEAGESNPKIGTLHKIANGLKVGLNDILDDTYTTYMIGNQKSVLFDEVGILLSIREQLNLSQEYISKASNMEIERYIQIEENKVKPSDSEISSIYNVLSSHGFKKSDMQFMKSGNENWVWISRKNNLLYCFDQLNEQGQEKAVESVELLTKIPEYKK